jgi:DNA-binding IscR family transcriptional regulator
MRASLGGLIEDKTLAVFTVLATNPGQLFHLNSLAKSAKVPITSTARIIKRLVESEFAIESKIGKISVYKIADNDKVRGLQELI